MNYASCGAPATTIPSVFHPREKGILAANSGNSHRKSANVGNILDKMITLFHFLKIQPQPLSSV